MWRVQNILKSRPDYAAGLDHYRKLRGVGAGMNLDAILNGTADLSQFTFDGGTPAAPDIPEIPDFTSHYGTQIDQILANINKMPQFSYDPEEDPAFQAYLAQYEAKGQTAFNNQLGALAAASGGRASSWASSAASQAQNAYVQQGMAALPQFMNAAYGRYRDSLGDMYQKAEFLLGLDDREFERYQVGIDNDFRTYSAQMDQYSQALQVKSQDFADALERTKLNGYVSNDDALILGVKPGTPSFEAQQAAREKQAWLDQEAARIKNEKEMLRYKYEMEKKYSSSRGSGSSSSGGYTSGNKSEINRYTKEYTDYIKGDEYQMMDDTAKRAYIEDMLAKIYSEYEDGYLDEKVAEKIVENIMTSDEYARLNTDPKKVLGGIFKTKEMKGLFNLGN